MHSSHEIFQKVMQHFASATKKNTSQTALFIARIGCKAIRCLCFRDVFHIILLKQSLLREKTHRL